MLYLLKKSHTVRFLSERTEASQLLPIQWNGRQNRIRYRYPRARRAGFCGGRPSLVVSKQGSDNLRFILTILRALYSHEMYLHHPRYIPLY